MNIRMRSYNYLPAVLLMVAAVVWVGSHTWRDLHQLHQSFTSVQADDIYTPVFIEARIREMNDTVLRIELNGNSQDRAAFESASKTLTEWLHARGNSLTTQEQRQLLNQIDAACRDYVTFSRQLIDQAPTNALNVPNANALAVVETNAMPVLNLCSQLKESERAEQAKFMKDSRQALAWIRDLLIVVLAVLLSLIITGAVATFRGVIGPLQVELSRSRTLAMRNEKLASLGTLAAGVAHEIRNPLTAINVRLHSLKKNLAKNSSEQEDALVIGHEINRLERIVQDFLQFARPAEPKFVVVSVDSLLAKVQSLLRAQLERASIELKLEHMADIWVRVDPYQMEQVLINLVKNAAESMENGGTITLRVSTDVKRPGSRNGASVCLEVIDTGRGISPDIIKHIFDPFFTTKEHGTGLGLVIASRIIEKHHGTLECRSELNHGTIFTILLPRSNPGEINEPTI